MPQTASKESKRDIKKGRGGQGRGGNVQGGEKKKGPLREYM